MIEKGGLRLMAIIWIFAGLIVGFIITYIVTMEIENEKLRRNPIPKKNNSDKRFCEIDNIYSHEIFGVIRGN